MDKETDKTTSPKEVGCLVNAFAVFIFVALIVITVLSKNFTDEKDKTAWMSFFGTLSCMYFIFMVALISRNHRNVKLKQSPALTSRATLISKNTEIRGRHTYTIYYLIFELESNVRKSFRVRREQYDMILEHESGELIYREQGKLMEFVDFNRDIDALSHNNQ